ncbi:hypothetical protein NQ314_017454 [Rhamnusium bicolor]|uniref:Uncharacterized protein n=1 Tax=Rhamnusium bicolor TaxID=1586634 RepID=A0AAV8WUC3_9CUCU|nr:hypothetical protein NQ314_017454 [Rhamnusium bicolor]
MKHHKTNTYNWDNQSVVLSAFFWGYVILQLPAAQLGKKFGAKWILVCCMTVDAIACLLIPISADCFGSTGVIMCRFLQGLAQGCISPLLHTLLGYWAPPCERSVIGTFSYAVLVDKTTYVATIEQMSFCLRYLDHEQIKNCENFLCFVAFISTAVHNISLAIFKTMKDPGLDIKYLKGQGYDGTRVMSTEFKGAQTLIDEYRQEVISKKTDELSPKSQKMHLKELYIKRWVERHDSIMIFVELLNAVCEAFDKIRSVFGNIVSLPITGFICSSCLGWPVAFYVFGALGLKWVLLWSFLGADRPGSHKRITSCEKVYIETSLGHETHKFHHTPWKAIFTSLPFWAVTFAFVGANWGSSVLLTQTPTYLNKILKYDIKSNSLLSAAPYLLMWLGTLIFSPVCDMLINKGTVSRGAARKIFNSIGTLLPAISLTLYDQSQWRTIFITAACVYTATDIFYLLFASGEVQSWNEVSTNEEEEEIQKSPENNYEKDVSKC